MPTTALMLALLLTACGDKDGDDTAGGGPGDGGATDGGASDGGTSDGGTSDGGTSDGGTSDGGGTAGPSVWDLVDPDNCTGLPDFKGVPGAASYFIGEYSPAGAPTSGVETWALYANPDWEAVGGADCKIVWNTTASTTSVGSCGTCDYGLSVSASIDLSATTCAEDLYTGDESWTASYDVDEQPDGTATWSYASTGTRIGGGYVTASGVSFITDDSCVWFGR